MDNPAANPRIKALARGLGYLSPISEALVRLRLFCYRTNICRTFRLGRRVISVGNITVGGTGKTPLVAYLTALFKERGKAVVILSRGYRRKGKGVEVISNGKGLLTSREKSGDEAYFLARLSGGVPIVVGKNRVRAGELAIERFDPDVILLDDGFQYLPLEREVDLVVIDSSNPFGTGRILPGGILREPLSSLKRADIFCLSRTDQAQDLDRLRALLRSINPEAPIFECIHSPSFLRRIPGGEKVDVRLLRGRRLFAFSAIGNPMAFERTLTDLGARLVGVRSYIDHYSYTTADIKEIAQQAKGSGAEFIVTTAKDMVRLPGGYHPCIEVFALEIRIEITRGADIIESIINPEA